jgi:beta-lactamase regulating signal transducer with metallopeptidase domain
MTLLILLGIMSISCRTIEVSPSNESINTSIKLAEKIEDPIKREVISSSLKDMKATIKTQSEIIEKYQKDLDEARKDAEEAQQAKGLVDGIVTIFWSIIALAGIYFIIKIVKRMGFV